MTTEHERRRREEPEFGKLLTLELKVRKALEIQAELSQAISERDTMLYKLEMLNRRIPELQLAVEDIAAARDELAKLNEAKQ